MKKTDGYYMIEGKGNAGEINFDNQKYWAKPIIFRYRFLSELFASFIAHYYNSETTLYFPAIDNMGNFYTLSKYFTEENYFYATSLLKGENDKSLTTLFKKIKALNPVNFEELSISLINDAFVLNTDRNTSNILITETNRIISSFDFERSLAYFIYQEPYQDYYTEGDIYELDLTNRKYSLSNIDSCCYPFENFFGKNTYLEQLEILKTDFNSHIEQILDTLDYEKMLIDFESFHGLSLEDKIKEIYINLGNTRLKTIKNKLYGRK